MRLVGFIGDIHGNESNLVAMDAVATDGDQHHRYPAGGGAATVLDSRDLGFVRAVAPDLMRRWTAGDVIWFAGRNLIARSSTNSVLSGFSATWSATPQGHRLTSGRPDTLRRFRDERGRLLANQLYRYLFDELERSTLGADLVLELYLAIENAACERRSLTTALYYREMRDPESYEFERHRAVLNKAFPSLDAFDRRLRELQDWLRQDRLIAVTKPDFVETNIFESLVEAQARFARHVSWNEFTFGSMSFVELVQAASQTESPKGKALRRADFGPVHNV